MKIFLVSVFAFSVAVSIEYPHEVEPAINMDYAHFCSLQTGIDEKDALNQVLLQSRALTPKWKDDWQVHAQVKELEYGKVAEFLMKSKHWQA